MYKIYEIEFGDTIDSIANKLNIDRNLLLMLNGFDSNKDLNIGEQIIIPVETSDKKYRSYIVKTGDNIYDIARNYGVNYKDVLILNGLNETDYIYPNQEILIPDINISLYKVLDGDTITTILNNTNNTIDEIVDNNREIFLLPEQVIFYKNNK